MSKIIYDEHSANKNEQKEFVNLMYMIKSESELYWIPDFNYEGNVCIFKF